MASEINIATEGVHKHGKKATTSSKIASKNVSKHPLVDLILTEESCCFKCSKFFHNGKIPYGRRG